MKASIEDILALPTKSRAEAFIPNTFSVDGHLRTQPRTQRIALLTRGIAAALGNAGGDDRVLSTDEIVTRFNRHRWGTLGEDPKPDDLFRSLASTVIKYSGSSKPGGILVIPALDARPELDDTNLDTALIGVREGMIAALREIAKGLNPEPRIVVMAQTPWEKPGKSTGWQTTDQGLDLCLTLVQGEQADPDANDVGFGGLEEWNIYARLPQAANAEK